MNLSLKDLIKLDEKAGEFIQKMNEKYCQSSLNLGKNIWIVKPAGNYFADAVLEPSCADN